MWVYAVDAKASVEALPIAHGLKTRVPLRWYGAAMRDALAAGRKSAAVRRATHMFDVGAARAALEAFEADHAPQTRAVRPDAADGEIVEKARRIAAEAQFRMIGVTTADALVLARVTCDAYGVEMPEAETPEGVVARAMCELWWRRKLRTTHARGAEASNIRLRFVHYGADCYASDDAVRRRVAQNRRNRATLTAVTLENQDGHRFTLAELADKSVSNKAIKRGELFTRLRGCEELASDAKYAGVMFTLTCPSRFHAVRQLAGGTRCIPNKRYDPALTPRDAQAYLRKTWARIRAQLNREGVSFFGMRVAEPHHDSTPHWHGLVFSNNVDRFCAVMRAHGLKDSGDERGASSRRVQFERIDTAKGSAVGYIAKYISKNIDGHAVGEHKTQEGFTVVPDLLGDLEITPSQRVETWAAQWGIRQFQAFGCAPVGVWRELRRVKADDLPTEAESAAIRDAWAAAQKTEERPADWAAFCRAMGGVAGEARMVYVKRTTEMREGRYGIVPAKVPHGVAARGVATVTDGLCTYSRETEIFVPATRHQWRVVSRSGEAASTRTCVNNCTEGEVDEVRRAREFDHRIGYRGGESGGGGTAPHVRRAVGV
ncbi:replication protein [Burkholderia territorii]|uniref:replication endonuclease n=1 Tax=Burkholderia territorii TaxID=1503055 RepID=UPI00075C5C49|nr:replication endonuclease [Burkholderia territorii]KVL36384.1 replication protein [Burkholderia territorii]